MYCQPEPLVYKEALELLKNGSDEELCLLGVRAGLYIDNWREAQDICLRLFENNDPRIRRNAVVGLMHIARIHGRLDKRLVKPYLIKELRDNIEFREYEEMLISDINMFLKWNLGNIKY